MWDAQVAPFTRYFRLVRYDRRGHGRSGVPKGPYTMDRLGRDVLAVLDALGIERVNWCGLSMGSMGGMVGQWLGTNAPERIEELLKLPSVSISAEGKLYVIPTASIQTIVVSPAPTGTIPVTGSTLIAVVSVTKSAAVSIVSIARAAVLGIVEAWPRLGPVHEHGGQPRKLTLLILVEAIVEGLLRSHEARQRGAHHGE